MSTYFRAKHDAYDYLTGYPVVKGELLTPLELHTQARYLQDDVFEIVEISRKKTYKSFGARFEMEGNKMAKNYYLADVKWKFSGNEHTNNLSFFANSLEELLEEAKKQYSFAEEFTVCNVTETRHLDFNAKYISGGVRVL